MSVSDSTATTAMPTVSRRLTPIRIVFCGTRSATTPAISAGSITPTAPAVEAIESWAAPPPIRMTSHTSPTTHTPMPNVLSTSATASRR